MSSLELLIDSDAFVGRFYSKDPHHEEALRMFAQFEEKQRMMAVTSMVVAETATVLSYRSGQTLARTFLDVVERSGLPVIHINEGLQQEAMAIFKAQAGRGTSVVDCANVAVIQRFRIPFIFSFDRFYFKQMKLGRPLAALN